MHTLARLRQWLRTALVCRAYAARDPRVAALWGKAAGWLS
jgi:hypothetical protein